MLRSERSHVCFDAVFFTIFIIRAQMMGPFHGPGKKLIECQLKLFMKSK